MTEQTAKIVAKLEKTAKSIIAHVQRGGYNTQTARASELICRYDDLREQCPREAWIAYCEAQGFHPSHNARDFFC